MKSSQINKPEYALNYLSIKNFKGIIDASINNLPKGAQWIFLTGENGYGKTSVLQALATSLYGSLSFKVGSKRSKLYCELHGSSEEFKLDQDSDLSIDDLYYESDFPMACYGSSRLDTYSESSSKSEEKSSIKSLFDTQSLLENIEIHFTRWYAKKDAKEDDAKEFKEKYEAVKKLLIELLDLKEIKVDFKTDKVYYIEKDSQGKEYDQLQLRDLASGYRNLISMIGDMIIRLFETQPKINIPGQLKGIVIIDELDLHLHPKWQKRLPELLCKLFPKIQFIASTHSPIPLLGAPKNSVIIRVNRNAEEGITLERLKDEESKISKLLPNSILTSPAFGMLEIFPATNLKGDLNTEDDYIKLKINEYLKEKLGNEQNSVLESKLLEYIHKNRR